MMLKLLVMTGQNQNLHILWLRWLAQAVRPEICTKV
jgi:hypothetical protein